LLALVALSCNEDPAPAGDLRPTDTLDAGHSDTNPSTGSKHDGGKPDAVATAQDARVEVDESPVRELDAGSPSEGTLPCAVQSVLAERCWTCHDAVPQFGAPVSLSTFEQLHAESPRAKAPYYQAVAARIQPDAKPAMPPAGQPPLSDAQRATLLEWIAAGAPAGEACAADAGPVDAGVVPPAADSDCDVSFELRGTDFQGGPYPVPLADDHYECFYFKTNIDKDTLATRLTPLLDKTNVLHHWLLFASENEDEAPSGTHAPCSGIHPGAALIAAWLPGTPEMVMPEDVGMEMPSGETSQFILENHYNNIPRYQGLTDNSGVKVCATKKPKSQHAAIHWLGSELISIPPGSTGSATGTCTPNQDGPVHILGVVPHMHKLGSHVNMVIHRKDGSTETLHDGAFEFESQGYFAKDVVLQPGDRVTTKCDYKNTYNRYVTLGERTGDEMCYMFTLAYPVGRMNTGGDYLNPFTGQAFIQGPNRCMR
jgi:cytochrome c551/c552